MSGTIRFLSCLVVLALAAIIAGSDATAGAPKKDNGKPKFTNRLAKETSPYLRMHAHNPVDWYPWGEEAFAKAKKEGKLIFLSIGYSSCYWCHVMARESFENEEVAALLNKWYVCIKVDREERPDIDQIYMAVLEVMGKNGGWPLSMFATADGRPIFGGTYWPREDRMFDGEVYKGFKSLVKVVHDVAAASPMDVEKSADKLAQATAALLSAPAKAGILSPSPDRATIKTALEDLRDSFDKEHGGFGSPLKKFKGPKFPMPCRLSFLLHEGQRTKSKELLDMVNLTLDKMALGGIYDQLGGGFHRYSTERTWSVPHFEKMLYDNAQLLEVYARAYQLTNKSLYKRVLQETLAYIQREMLSPEGAFYSSQDAETEEEEGRFFVWTLQELEKALPNADDLKLVRKVYSADGAPNFEKKYYILTLQRPLAESAKELGLTSAQLLAKLQPLKEKLFKARSEREKPLLNTIALTSWSGLAIAGFAEAGRALDDPKAIQVAKKAADFILKKQVTKDGRLLRTYGAAPGEKAKAAVKGFLEDYACLVHGLLTLHEVTGEKRWLHEAENLTKTMIEHHGDQKSAGYYFTAHDAEKFFARGKDSFDGAMPSGNSQALFNLVRLWIMTGNEFYKKETEQGFDSFAKTLDDQPTGLTTMMHALSLYLDKEGKKEKEQPGGELTLPGQQPKDKKLDPVKAEASAGKVNDQGEQTITITVTIEKGWHIYANPVGNEELEGADTVVKVTGKGLTKVVKITYPAGKEEKSIVGKFKAYEIKAVITAVVQRAKDDAELLEVSVRYQACDANQCLLPKTIKLKVP